MASVGEQIVDGLNALRESITRLQLANERYYALQSQQHSSSGSGGSSGKAIRQPQQVNTFQDWVHQTGSLVGALQKLTLAVEQDNQRRGQKQSIPMSLLMAQTGTGKFGSSVRHLVAKGRQWQDRGQRMQSVGQKQVQRAEKRLEEVKTKAEPRIRAARKNLVRAQRGQAPKIERAKKNLEKAERQAAQPATSIAHRRQNRRAVDKATTRLQKARAPVERAEQRFRKATAPVVQAQQAVKAAGGVRAAGGLAEAAGGAMRFAGVVGAAGAAVVGFYKSITDATDAAMESAKKYAEMSGAMAAVMAQRDLREMQRDQKIGDETAESTGGLANAEQDRKDAIAPLEITITNFKNNLLQSMNEFFTPCLKLLSDILGKGDKEGEVSVTVAGRMARAHAENQAARERGDRWFARPRIDD